MSRAIDKEFEDADDTGVLDISGRNLRQFPVIPGDMLDFSYIFEAGRCGYGRGLPKSHIRSKNLSVAAGHMRVISMASVL